MLFLLYINDLPDCSQMQPYLMADDKTSFEIDTNLSDLINRVNEFRKIAPFLGLPK
jgi:hypothetical protein